MAYYLAYIPLLYNVLREKLLVDVFLNFCLKDRAFSLLKNIQYKKKRLKALNSVQQLREICYIEFILRISYIIYKQRSVGHHFFKIFDDS